MNNQMTTAPLDFSADYPLSVLQKIQWIWTCKKNNSLPFDELDDRIEQLNFEVVNERQKRSFSAIFQSDKSPARMYSDAFWEYFDFSELSYNGRINILEVGCGSGIYGVKLKRLLKNRLKIYRGIDILEHDNWMKLKSNHGFEFYVDKAENIQKYLSEINLIITQSAVEHFENDLDFFKSIAEYRGESDKEIWQIHLFPSAHCLGTYLWHGYRQYTPRSISKITKLFASDKHLMCYRLGGKRSNMVHKAFITYPSLIGLNFGKNFPGIYKKFLKEALESDLKDGFRAPASFYALVIK